MIGAGKMPRPDRSGRIHAAAVILLLTLAPAPAAGQAPPEPPAYRMEQYRAPVPATLAGARVVSVQEARCLWQEKAAIFIDVLPRPVKPANLPAGTVWRDRPRDDIPGSVWLPNVGYGALPPRMEAYFRDGLARATGGDAARPILVYCLADCWMSWNAAKRALQLGYANVIWFPEGSDGWAAAGHPLERREPVPLP